jgi:mannose-6-phosphate isomerase-like protein (cupin superfamily)
LRIPAIASESCGLDPADRAIARETKNARRALSVEKEGRMKGYVTNIEKDSLDNNDFRRVLYTAKHSQLVLMSLRPKEDIGEETHNLDQFIRVEAGRGVSILDGVRHQISDGSAVVIPAGTRHNIVNESDTEELKLYTLYSPPEHRDGVVHRTKAEATAHEEHFDGKTTE